MIYLLVVTALLNGHPDTQATGRYIDKADCQKAEARYRAAQVKAGIKVYATACLPMDNK